MMATKAEVEQWKDLSDETEAAKAIADGLEWQVEELQAENAKLRELVSGLMCCPVYQDACVKCKHVKVVPKEETGNWPRYVCTLCERAKEMGIEVDG